MGAEKSFVTLEKILSWICIKKTNLRPFNTLHSGGEYDPYNSSESSNIDMELIRVGDSYKEAMRCKRVCLRKHSCINDYNFKSLKCLRKFKMLLTQLKNNL